MASPVDAGRIDTNISTASDPWTVNLPSNIQSGDLLIIHLRSSQWYVYPTTSPTGWTWLGGEDATDASDDYQYCFYRWADGNEGSSVSVNMVSSCKGSAIAWRITGAENPTTQPPEIVSNFGSTANANPTSITPNGGTKDYLFLCAIGCDGETQTFSVPSGYGNLQQANSGTGGSAASNTRSGGCSRQATTDTENPAAWTHAAPSNGWISHVIAIHPPGGPTTHYGAFALTATGNRSFAARRTTHSAFAMTATGARVFNAVRTTHSSFAMTATGARAFAGVRTVVGAFSLTAIGGLYVNGIGIHFPTTYYGAFALTATGGRAFNGLRTTHAGFTLHGYGGVKNLNENGGFETNLTPWVPYQTRSEISRVTSEHQFGTASAKVVCIDDQGYDFGMYRQLDGLKKGQTYTFSAWVKAEGTAVGKGNRLYLQDYPGGGTSMDMFTMTDEWQLRTVTRTILDDSVLIFFYMPGASELGDTFYVDGVQFEEGGATHNYVETDGVARTANFFNALRTTFSSFALTGTGNRAFNALRIALGAFALTATGGRAFNALRTTHSSFALTATGGLYVNGVSSGGVTTWYGDFALTGVGGRSFNALRTTYSSFALTGSGNRAVNALRTTHSAFAFTGTGSLYFNAFVSSSNIRPDSVVHDRAFGEPSVATHITLLPSAIVHTRAFGQARIKLIVAPESVVHTRGVGEPTIELGEVEIEPTSVVHTRGWGTALVGSSEATLEPVSVVHNRGFGATTVWAPAQPVILQQIIYGFLGQEGQSARLHINPDLREIPRTENITVYGGFSLTAVGGFYVNGWIEPPDNYGEGPYGSGDYTR